ncbi:MULTISPECIES: Flp1 family type IVb pilin [Paenibacillus]|uniref:Putative Flp1-like flagellin n=1 Tax=Paenibacillus naphthalenovorans TaxID=162209 RepID=A0A0U2UKI9_9BACL|nr:MULTISPECIES: Flp1 family type IVb pilin [Paenibacillus]ALS22465.1 putative Flp1-like flagellin [Paenibacillus naphthalenovorans]NTZ16917.1 hypothetical protein [Paenibacillus sp. JMULE4]GCL70253.1 hypothetical protein PN4B1_01530 [Paenibacillus naphthalenovorans]SDH87598.1 Putative Flagellin, Flp1-like, domain [Paenibacillus naphthalenovorans]
MNNWPIGWKPLWEEEDGLGTLEILLIVAVLIIIAIAFRKWIIEWIDGLFKSANQEIIDNQNNYESDKVRINPPASQN